MLNAIAAGAMMLSSLSAPVTGSGMHIVAPPDEMTVSVVYANGSGCKPGTAAVEVSPDKKAFTVTYSAFTAQVGPESSPTDFRKNCQLGLNVDVPSGYTYAIAQADYRGYARLEKGAYASQRAFYYFQGMSHTTETNRKFNGFLDDFWQETDLVEVESLTWHPCGAQRYLNVNTDLRVNRGTSDKTTTSFITMDSSDMSLTTLYRVVFAEC
jgi:hypothetical protein